MGYARSIRGSINLGSTTLKDATSRFHRLGLGSHLAKETEDIEKDMKRELKLLGFIRSLCCCQMCPSLITECTNTHKS